MGQARGLNSGYKIARVTVERANRTLGEMAECLRMTAQLPPSCWGYARLYAAFLRNRSTSPSSSNPRHQSPYFMIHRKLPDLRDVRIFGVQCFAMIPKGQRANKLSDKAFKATFVGISEKFRSYMVIPDGASKPV